MPVIDFRIRLLKDLQDPEFANGYLEECRKLGPGEYEIALRDVAEAIATKARTEVPDNLGRSTQKFYTLLSEEFRKIGAADSKRSMRSRSSASQPAIKHAPARAPQKARASRG